MNCGHVLPLMSAACKELSQRMPVVKGQIGDRTVSVLRDSGCSGVVVRQELVEPSSLTGQNKMCVLIDGSVRKAPVANVYLNTPFFVGQTEALCMQNTLYDVIVGNIAGARSPGDPDRHWCYSNSHEPQDQQTVVQTQAVQTRAQKRVTEKPLKKLKIPEAIPDIHKEDFMRAQQNDPSLNRIRELISLKGERTTKRGGRSRFLDLPQI